ncbi:hypothetical protein ACU4GA_05035 [Methylobacterium oryzae CBMB20]
MTVPDGPFCDAPRGQALRWIKDLDGRRRGRLRMIVPSGNEAPPTHPVSRGRRRSIQCRLTDVYSCRHPDDRNSSAAIEHDWQSRAVRPRNPASMREPGLIQVKAELRPVSYPPQDPYPRDANQSEPWPPHLLPSI